MPKVRESLRSFHYTKNMIKIKKVWEGDHEILPVVCP